MKYETETGMGYLTDDQGKVKFRVHVDPGKHETEDGLTFHEVSSRSNLPDVDPTYKVDSPPGKPFDDRVKEVLREEGLI